MCSHTYVNICQSGTSYDSFQNQLISVHPSKYLGLIFSVSLAVPHPLEDQDGELPREPAQEPVMHQMKTSCRSLDAARPGMPVRAFSYMAPEGKEIASVLSFLRILYEQDAAHSVMARVIVLNCEHISVAEFRRVVGDRFTVTWRLCRILPTNPRVGRFVLLSPIRVILGPLSSKSSMVEFSSCLLSRKKSGRS